MPIDHRNLLWNINFLKFPWLFLNFPDFQQNSKFPWQILKFPDFSLTLNFPDFSLTSGNPVFTVVLKVSHVIMPIVMSNGDFLQGTNINKLEYP